jgi:hypothetical protein
MLERASLRGQPRAAGRARGPADLFADIRGVAPPPGGLLVSVRVAFQGELGSYSEAALAQYFEDYEPIPCHTFRAVVERVCAGEATAACPWRTPPCEPSRRAALSLGDLARGN